MIDLHHGDCLDVLAGMQDGSVDVILTDPPYAQDVYLRSAAAAKHQLTGPNPCGRPSLAAMAAGAIGSIDTLAAPVAAHVARLTKRWALVFSDVEFCHEWRRLLELEGMRYVRTGGWAKLYAMPQMSGDRPAVGFEPCTIVHAQGPMRWNGGGLPALWTYPIAKGKARPEHPCPKPLPLMRRLVELFTDPGDVVLDPFMGSGTTGVACKELGRDFIGIELDAEYYRIAKARIEAARHKPGLCFERTKRRKDRRLI